MKLVGIGLFQLEDWMDKLVGIRQFQLEDWMFSSSSSHYNVKWYMPKEIYMEWKVNLEFSMADHVIVKGLTQLILFSLFNMTRLGNTQKVILST